MTGANNNENNSLDDLYSNFGSTSDSEMAQEISSLKEQLRSMQQALYDIQSSSLISSENFNSSQNNGNNGNQNKQNNQNSNGNFKNSQALNTLLKQISDFRKEAQKQQEQAQMEVEKSISQAIQILQQANDQIHSNAALTQMNVLIDQAQQQLNGMGSMPKNNEGKKDKNKA